MFSEARTDKRLRKVVYERALTFTLIEMTATGLRFLKQVNLINNIRDRLQDYLWLMVEDEEDLLASVNVSIKVNNKADVIIHLSETSKKASTDIQIFYFE